MKKLDNNQSGFLTMLITIILILIIVIVFVFLRVDHASIIKTHLKV